MNSARKIILIGGSAGSFRPMCSMIANFHMPLKFPIIVVLHRMKSISHGFAEALQPAPASLPIVEPEDKDPILPGLIYLAPANYHLLVEGPHRFSLSTDECIQYSRPSIDVTLASAAQVFGEKCVAIIMSGANRDGARGAAEIKKQGGVVIVQDLVECEVPAMVAETLRLVPDAIQKGHRAITEYINTL